MDIKEFFGEWWIPEAPEIKFIGRIIIDFNSFSTLEINGRFKLDSPNIILGINHKGEKITLIENSLANYTIYRTELCKFESHIVIFSKHFNSIDSIKITSFNVYYYGLEEWTCLNSIERSLDNNVLTITTKDFIEQELFSNEIYSIEIHNKCNWLQNSLPYRNVDLQQTDFFIITLKKELTLNYINIEILQPLKLFLTLSMSNSTDFNSIVAYYENNASFNINYCKRNINRNSKKTKHNMLFDLSKVIDNFNLYYAKWLDLVNKIKPIHYYYFEVLEHASIKHFYDRDFWTITVALESLHRCIYKDIKIEETEKIYQNNLKILKDKLTSLEFDEISKYLLKPSEMNLRKRLKFYLKKFSKFSDQFFQNSNSKKSFVNKILATRNFQTHLDNSKTYKTVNDDEFFEYLWLMMRLFELSLLESIGFDEDEILELFKNYEDYNIMQKYFLRQNHPIRVK